jgi:hypothetical protein
VVASNRPLPVANEDVVDKADAGKPQTVNVLANDFNPFPETPLRIVSASVETGSAAGQPAVAGDSINVTPAAGFKGVMVVRYSVMDKTDDVSRQTDGRLRITVRDRPDAPSAPTATDVRSRTAVLKWTPPSDNGAAITKYTVRSGNGFSQECATTTCTLSGLTNDVKYVFTVSATNEVRESDPSPPSNEIRPDEKPSPPEAPTVKAGDRTMVIAWPAARTEGSAVKNYNLEISPPPANGVAVKNGVAGLNYTWPGLTNGVRYKVRAQAVNDLGPSDWGQYSAEDNPAGVPAAPGAPTSSVASAVGSSNQLKVDWNEPNTNGDAIKNYYVTMSGGGGGVAQTQVVAGTVRTANFSANNSEASYTFTVQAENKAGKGAVSAPSAPRRATGKLGQVSGVSATEANTGGAGRSVTVTFRELTAAERNGSASSEVSYTYRASTGQSGPIKPGQTVGGFANGAGTAITVTANSSVAPSSDASAPATANPYGSPGTPSASGTDGAENQRNLTLSWGSPDAGSHDIAYTQIRIDGGGWERVGASGSRTINTGGFNERHSIEVQTVNSRGTGGPLASASAQSGAQKTRWTTRLNTGMDRSCTDLPGATSYDPAKFTCDGQGGYNRPWMSHFDSFDVMCWKPHGTTYSGDGQWYYIMRGSPNGTRWIQSLHTSIGSPAQSGVPLCTFPTGATP